MRKKFALRAVTLALTLSVVIWLSAVLIFFSRFPEVSQLQRHRFFQGNVLAKLNSVGSPTDHSAKQASKKKSQARGIASAAQNVESAKLNSDLSFSDREIFNELLNPDKPLTQSCRHLEKVAQSMRDLSENEDRYNYVVQNLVKGSLNPVAESLAPLLRYIFRAPGVDKIVNHVLQSQNVNEQNEKQNVEFYWDLYQWAQYLTENKTQIDQILQKTYNLHQLMKVIQQKPNLANDTRTSQYCEFLEAMINSEQEFNFEDAAIEMQNYLEQVGVDAQQIGYDPNYRSDSTIFFSGTQVFLNDTWVLDFLKKESND